MRVCKNSKFTHDARRSFHFLFFLWILIGCAASNNTSQVDLDYRILLAEQIRAHHNAGFDTPFRQVLDDYAAFKQQLYTVIADKFTHQFRPEEFKQIETILAAGMPDFKNNPAYGVDVFQRFQGRWRGEWLQNRQRTMYDQIWFTPYETESGLIAQKVIIRKWDDRHQKPLSEIAAINTYNPKNHLILGAVDIHRSERKSAYAPHLGFRINSHTFIWIGCVAAGTGDPSYSLYFEKISTIDAVGHYKIKCVGFNWNRQSNKIANLTWREGQYVQIGTVASVSAGN